MIGGRIAQGLAVPGTTLSILVVPVSVRLMSTIFLMPMGGTRYALGYRPLAAAGTNSDYIYSNRFMSNRATTVFSNFLLQENTQLLLITGTFTVAINVFAYPFYGKVIADIV